MSIPHNAFAETAVLGTILSNPQAAFAMEALVIDDFVIDTNRHVFEAMAMAAQDGKLPTMPTVAPVLAAHPNRAVNYLQIAMQLVREKLPLEDFVGAMQSLKEFTGRRLMLVIAEQMGGVARNHTSSLLAFNEEVVSQLNDISVGIRHARATAFSLGEWTERMVGDLKSGKKPDLVTTGLLDLDREIGGWARKEVSIIAGRSSMGKTTVAISSLRQAAQKGVRSMFFSMEMAGDKIAARMLSDAIFNLQTPIPYSDIIRHRVKPWDIDRLAKMSERMRDVPMIIDDQSGLNVTEIATRARRQQDALGRTGDKLDVICVDHLGFVKPSSRYRGNRNLELGEITKAFKDISKQLDVAVVLLCQLNREAEKRSNRRPEMSDLRESGQIEEDADTVLLAYRDAYYLAKDRGETDADESERLAKLEMMENIIEIIGPKSRNGGVFSRRFFCHMPSNVIRDAA